MISPKNILTVRFGGENTMVWYSADGGTGLHIIEWIGRHQGQTMTTANETQNWLRERTASHEVNQIKKLWKEQSQGKKKNGPKSKLSNGCFQFLNRGVLKPFNNKGFYAIN